MKIKDMFGQRPLFSFEIFPPKSTSPIETIYKTLDAVAGFEPDYISVTYGAGGNPADTSTMDICGIIRRKYNIEPLAHLTCVNTKKRDLDTILDGLSSCGVENILALRGDLKEGTAPAKDFTYASDLAAYISSYGGFGIAGACYPEVHFEAADAVADIMNLKKKVESGVTTLSTQMFFDNEKFYSFIEKIRLAGINVPVEAGIMPIVNPSQINRMIALSGATLPAKFVKMFQRYETKPEAFREAGIAYAVDQIVDLLSSGVDGIHLYTMNNPYVAKRISDSILPIIRPKTEQN